MKASLHNFYEQKQCNTTLCEVEKLPSTTFCNVRKVGWPTAVLWHQRTYSYTNKMSCFCVELASTGEHPVRQVDQPMAVGGSEERKKNKKGRIKVGR